MKFLSSHSEGYFSFEKKRKKVENFDSKEILKEEVTL